MNRPIAWRLDRRGLATRETMRKTPALPLKAKMQLNVVDPETHAGLFTLATRAFASVRPRFLFARWRLKYTFRI